MILKTQSLTPNIRDIVFNKATEAPFSGEYENNTKNGTYLCRLCGIALFRTQDQFNSACGWPSFDEKIFGRAILQTDEDGLRTEILCKRCKAHLGHVFTGERFTAKNTRYCVNSLSLDFVFDPNVQDSAEWIVAAGCFWGVEYCFQQYPGVIKTEVGYIGGHIDFPKYEQVCAGFTGHLEGVRIVYDPTKIDSEQLIQYFFSIHNPSQDNGQGPDIGEQYKSAIFYYDELQKIIAEKVIVALKNKDRIITTQLLPMKIFWPAESQHQQYYQKNGKLPYCHFVPKK